MLTGFSKVLALSSAACLVMCVSPPLAVISAIIWGITLLLGVNFLVRGQLFLILGLNLLLLFGVAGNSILFLLLIFGLPSFIMGLQLATQKGYYELQMWGMLSAILLVSLYLGMAFYYSDPYYKIIPEQINRNVEESIKIVEDSGMLQFYQQQGLSQEELKTELTAIYYWAYRHLAAWYYLEAMLAVFVVLRLGAYVCRRNGLVILEQSLFRRDYALASGLGGHCWISFVAMGARPKHELVLCRLQPLNDCHADYFILRDSHSSISMAEDIRSGPPVMVNRFDIDYTNISPTSHNFCWPFGSF